MVKASGYVDWESKNLDQFYGGIVDNAIGYVEADFMDNMISISDYGCTDSSDQYTNFMLTRTFTVSSAGTYRYDLYGVIPHAISKVELGDITMSVMYFPEGSAIYSSP